MLAANMLVTERLHPSAKPVEDLSGGPIHWWIVKRLSNDTRALDHATKIGGATLRMRMNSRTGILGSMLKAFSRSTTPLQGQLWQIGLLQYWP